ncbi:uncharacterized protein LOC124374729 [Homalodisca vitripennis]|uniref:uncharacterized protein LOC124374729 n=1 Tax=Homalodisca vitripennis TaxID=197043 RepID=UPI001EEA80F3|nr:uncharacterized protein LOC124374729 [Homalodisca vitripennis]
MAVSYPNIKLLPLHLLPRQVYTSHGLHFNKKGKVRIAEMVNKLMQIKGPHQNPADATKVPSNMIQHRNGGGIIVVEEEMSKVIERYNNDPTVGLAHTVSRDFQMSAGVAVVFRKKFGRPQMSDLIFQNLAYQQVNEGLSVYSLVTKEMYYGKPTNEEYDTAFQQLKIDFQTRGLKVLICSAMGCVRDLIQPQHFVDRISEFQKATGATVYIVSYNQEVKRKLWRGMSHEEFVKTLRQLIADRMEREQSSAPEENKAEDRSATPDINSAQASGSSNEFTPPALVP